jgi:GNAT superfamily N-acetyltransferase
MSATPPTRFATPADASLAARLLWDFNTEFDTPTPDPAVLTARLAHLLTTGTTLAILGGEAADGVGAAGTGAAGTGAVGIGLVTLRTNVWFDGAVALLDELYVAPTHRGQGIGTAMIAALTERAVAEAWGLLEVNVDEFDADARRFYERHGFANVEQGSTERALYYWRELGT